MIGAALKTLGLSYNSSAADLRRCGLTEEDLRLRVQRFVKQARCEGRPRKQGREWGQTGVQRGAKQGAGAEAGGAGQGAHGRLRPSSHRPPLPSTAVNACRLAFLSQSQAQVRVFSSSNHVRALAAGEVDAVVGWSGVLACCLPAQQPCPTRRPALLGGWPRLSDFELAHASPLHTPLL